MWKMLYLIAFVANDIIDQEPWNFVSIDRVNDHFTIDQRISDVFVFIFPVQEL